MDLEVYMEKFKVGKSVSNLIDRILPEEDQ